MLRNNNLSPLPFYESLAEQDFRKWYTQGEMYPLRVSASRLLPFRFAVPSISSASVTRVELFKCCDERTLSAGSFEPNSFSSAFHIYNTPSGTFDTILASHISVHSFGGYATFYYTAPNIELGLTRGFFYAKVYALVDGVAKEFFSELFYAVPAADLMVNSTKLQWYDEEDLDLGEGIIPYAHSEGGRYYGGELFLDAEIGMPEYSFTEEGEERDGRFFPVKQISEKVYRTTFVAPEYMCDCLRLACQSDVVKVEDRLGRKYAVEHFAMEVKWLDGGYRAEVSVTFETDAVVKKIGRSYGAIPDR